MPYSLRDIPHGLFGSDFAVGSADIGQANLRPDNIGLKVANVTGSSIPAGSLVYLSGWDTSVAAAGMPSISLASANAQVTRAQWVTLAAIANNALGVVGQHFALAAQNTNSVNVGDPVYLNTTAGGYTFTPALQGALIYQIVGRVAVKSATVGLIEFNLLSGSVAPPLVRMTVPLPAIGTAAGTYAQEWVAPAPGLVAGAKAVFRTSLAIDGTNFVTVSILNLSNSSANLLSAVSPANSTFTGGTAITADTAYPLTLSGTAGNLVIAAGDNIKVQAVVSGTLGGALAAGSVVSIALQPS